MSGRGGGGGGRRSDSGRGQQSSQGRGAGRGRGRGGQGPPTGIVPPRQQTTPSVSSPAPATVSVAAPRQQTKPSVSSPAPSPAPAAVSVAAPPAPASTSLSESISRDVERLQLHHQPEDLPASSKALTLPQRPGFGRVGHKCVVRANHFAVQVADNDLYHYDVTITPEVTAKKFKREILCQLVKLYGSSHLGKREPAYDGQKSLFTAGKLPFESREFAVTIVENEGKAGGSQSKRKDRQFKVAIKFASTPDLHYLKEFLRGRHADVPQETIQVLDVVLRAGASEKYVVAGRSFFSPSLGDRGPLADGIEYYKGFYQSLRPTQMGLSLNTDISARSFYEPLLVSDFVLKHFNRRDLSRPLSDQERLKLKKALRGLKVVATYLSYPRNYKVSGISREAINKISFTLDDKKTKMTVAQYYKEKYNVVLRHPSLPALQAGPDTKPVYLPMELCRIADGQRYTKKLNEKQVTALLRATCERPNVRESNIKKRVESNNFNGTKVVNEFGIQVAPELAVIEARVLPAPMLQYHATGRESKVLPKVGQWNMINLKMVNGGRVGFWACINFSQRVDPHFPSTFCMELVNMCASKGMAFNPNPVFPITHGNPSNIDASLRDVERQADGKLKPQEKLQLLIVILPDFTGSYPLIKRICETELGIVTQCCRPQQAFKLSKQYLENLSLKINVKVGGRNTVLIDAVERKIPLLTDRPTIVFGADVTHPQPGDDSSPSIAAVVASMDWPEVVKYRSIVSAQGHREEIILDLYKDDVGSSSKGIIWELLRSFYRSVRQKPHRIIFYRDGVSEGQFSQVLLHEVLAIRKACAALEEGYAPPITFVVVQKRHHTRLFPTDRNMTDRSGNILPGTVVDTKICHPTQFDFYLNSHAGIQGTSRPTHYHVLYDENRFTADGLQMLTNSLCYTYARCTRSVSIVPPAYYAHLAAFRARDYLTGDGSDIGSTSEGRGAGERNVEVRVLPSIMENVKEVMFYC